MSNKRQIKPGKKRETPEDLAYKTQLPVVEYHNGRAFDFRAVTRPESFEDLPTTLNIHQPKNFVIQAVRSPQMVNRCSLITQDARYDICDVKIKKKGIEVYYLLDGNWQMDYVPKNEIVRLVQLN